MPTYRLILQSDPLSPAAVERWTQVQGVLDHQGWTQGQESWGLTLDPSGGTSAWTRLEETVARLSTEASPGATHRAWWSMSDNCLILNALIDRGYCRIFHGHPLTLAGRDQAAQKHRFALWSRALVEGVAFPREALPPIVPVQGTWPEVGQVVGGNLTALERLATTPWRPRSDGRFLLLESLSADEGAMERVLALVRDPWWKSIAGVLVGRFSAADRRDPAWFDRLAGLWPPHVPLARWPAVGHGSDGWTVPLGETIPFL